MTTYNRQIRNRTTSQVANLSLLSEKNKFNLQFGNLKLVKKGKNTSKAHYSESSITP